MNTFKNVESPTTNATNTLALRVGVGLATLCGCVLFSAVTIAASTGARRDDASHFVRLALPFIVLFAALAPVIANSVRSTLPQRRRMLAAAFWIALLPFITMFPFGLTFDGGLGQVIRYSTYGLWMCGAIGGVSFAAVFAQRTAFVLPPSPWRTRLLTGAGVIMSAVTIMFVVPAMILVLGAVSIGFFEPPADEYVLPERFSGRALISYNDSTAPELQRTRQGVLVYHFPASGQLRRGDPDEGSRRMPKVFLQTASAAAVQSLAARVRNVEA